MKVLLTVLALLVTTRPLLPQAAGGVDAEQSKILTLENAWNQAEKHKDGKALETLLHPDLVYVDYDGSMMTKVEFIASVKDPTLNPNRS
jgi:hypothetical protein